jgi:hypothetical protein
MISVSLPKDSTAVGLGINSMLRSLGGAVGPVLATTIMVSYTVPLIVLVGGQPTMVGQFPSSTAFDVIFVSGIVLALIAAILSLAIKNYTFKQGAQAKGKGAGETGAADPPAKR